MPRPEILEDIAEEQSTIFIKCDFKDEDGDSVTPTAVVWDLTTLDGTVIAYNQSETPASPLYIEISGTNLRILTNEESEGERVLTVRATYNSDRGSGLPLNKAVRFNIRNLLMIAYPIDISVVDTAWVSDYLESTSIG